jgi:hypothetical protein
MIEAFLPVLLLATGFHLSLERGWLTDERLLLIGAWPWHTVCLCAVTATCLVHSAKSLLPPMLTALTALACFAMMLYGAVLMCIYALSDADKRHEIVAELLRLLSTLRSHTQ